MKIEKKLKIALIILFIVLISLISFGGIFVQKTKSVKNIIPEYKLGMDLKGARKIELTTANGKDLKKEDFLKAKKVLENRLKQMEVIDSKLNLSKAVDYYELKFDEETGNAIIQIPENLNTDTIVQMIPVKGDFSFVDDETGDVLLDNSHIKKAVVQYGSTEEGTRVYLTIGFDKEAVQILKDITNTYVKTTDEKGNESSKTISFKVDETKLLSTYFEQEISDGIIQFALGTSNSAGELAQYVQEASNLALLLNTGNLPVSYTIDSNRYVMSNITANMFIVPAIVIAVALIGGIVILIVKYKKNGIFASISLIGYIALLLLVIRYTNVIISLEGIVSIIIAIALNYTFIMYLLKLIRDKKAVTVEDVLNANKENLIKFLFILIPVAITTIIFSFVKWLPIYSFGMVMFYGLILIVIHNWIITRTLLKWTTERK